MRNLTQAEICNTSGGCADWWCEMGIILDMPSVGGPELPQLPDAPTGTINVRPPVPPVGVIMIPQINGGPWIIPA